MIIPITIHIRVKVIYVHKKISSMEKIEDSNFTDMRTSQVS